MAILTRDKILDAWTRLGELAHAKGQLIQLTVVGGAVMAVYFRSRASTADVDGIFAPTPETRQWAHEVAEQLGLALEAEPGVDCASPEELPKLVEPYLVPPRRMMAS